MKRKIEILINEPIIVRTTAASSLKKFHSTKIRSKNNELIKQH